MEDSHEQPSNDFEDGKGAAASSCSIGMRHVMILKGAAYFGRVLSKSCYNPLRRLITMVSGL